MSRKVDKNQTILKTLLRESANSNCADCKTAAHPRWASWNLGIFICIRCSGIHRSMGTHISRVKSVDLDTWTDEQVKSMIAWGNDKANQFWESGLPNGYIPDESKIENFIRTKYDLKKWCQFKQVPDPSQLTSSSRSTPIPTPAPTLENRKSYTNGLLDLEFTSPIAKDSRVQQQAPVQQTSQYQQQQYQHQHQQQQQQQPAQVSRDRPELKKSILSLYSTPLVANSTPTFQQHSNINTSTSSVNQINQWSQPKPQQQTYNNGLDDDLFKNVWK